MIKLNLLNYRLTVLMMAFAIMLCYSCNKEDNPFYEDGKISGTINDHAYVELAGTKWATENVGAVNGLEERKHETYGYYYTYEEALTAAGSWGSNWGLPTREQLLKIIEECDWRWKDGYHFGGKSMNGFLVTDKKNGNSIFLPSAGYYNKIVYGHGNFGKYWSSTPLGSNKAYYMNFRYLERDPSGVKYVDHYEIDYNYSVRLVAK